MCAMDAAKDVCVCVPGLVGIIAPRDWMFLLLPLPTCVVNCMELYNKREVKKFKLEFEYNLLHFTMPLVHSVTWYKILWHIFVYVVNMPRYTTL